MGPPLLEWPSPHRRCSLDSVVLPETHRLVGTLYNLKREPNEAIRIQHD